MKNGSKVIQGHCVGRLKIRRKTHGKMLIRRKKKNHRLHFSCFDRNICLNMVFYNSIYIFFSLRRVFKIIILHHWYTRPSKRNARRTKRSHSNIFSTNNLWFKSVKVYLKNKTYINVTNIVTRSYINKI